MVSFLSMTWACLGMSRENMCSSGEPRRPNMNCTVASKCSVDMISDVHHIIPIILSYDIE